VYISIDVSPGELLDKITILEIKTQRITDPQKLKHVKQMLDMLQRSRTGVLPTNGQITTLEKKLLQINSRLWDIEDIIRGHERVGDFGEVFVSLARSVYRLNDERAAVKRKIDLALGATYLEEKAYSDA